MITKQWRAKHNDEVHCQTFALLNNMVQYKTICLLIFYYGLSSQGANFQKFHKKFHKSWTLCWAISEVWLCVLVHKWESTYHMRPCTIWCNLFNCNVAVLFLLLTIVTLCGLLYLYHFWDLYSKYMPDLLATCLIMLVYIVRVTLVEHRHFIHLFDT